MALTYRKRKFVNAIQSGLSGANAAVAAGYSEKGASQAASRLMKDADVIAAIERTKVVEQAGPSAECNPPAITGLNEHYDDPKDYLRAVMNNPLEDPKIRLDAAKSLMPYEHHRKGGGGKKEAERAAAGRAGVGRFSSAPPPIRVVNGQ